VGTRPQEGPIVTIADALAALVAELREGDVPDPLNQRFKLAFVYADLCRLAGELVPAEVSRALDEPAGHRLPVAEVRRWLPAIAD
jgi:hypothetical protein